MTYQPLENYGFIGDLHTVALVGIDGSIDYMCFPHFDSPTVFGALLDDDKGGRFGSRPLRRDLATSRCTCPTPTCSSPGSSASTESQRSPTSCRWRTCGTPTSSSAG